MWHGLVILIYITLAPKQTCSQYIAITQAEPYITINVCGRMVMQLTTTMLCRIQCYSALGQQKLRPI